MNVPGITHGAPIPLGCRVGDIVHSSGIVGVDPGTGLLPPDPASEVAQAFTNLESFLSAAGVTTGDVVRLSVTVNDEKIRDEMNVHWLRLFPDEDDRPARHTGVGPLRGGSSIQLEVIAVAAGDR